MAELKIDIIAGIDKLSASLKEVENKFSKLGSKLTSIGSSLSMSVTAPILAIGAVAANEFATVEKGLREINSLFGLTGEEAEKNFGMLSKVAEDASKELGILQSDVVPAMYNAISAGVPKENIFEFIKVAGNAAIGGVTDLNTSVDGLTSIINAFGLSMNQAEEVADSMFAAVQGGKTTFSELSDSIFNIAPAAAAAGVSFNEVNAAIATLTAGGTPTAVATTQIRAALTGLQRPSKELNAIFQKLGFETAQVAIEKKGLGFALDAVKKASNGSNGELQTLLGSTEAVAAANVLAGTGAAKFTAELDRQANSAGAASGAAAEINKSFGRELERTKVAASNLGISLGATLAPALSGLNSIIEKSISFFSNLSPRTQTVIVVFAGLAAAIGPILLGIGGIVGLIPTLTAGLAVIKTAFMGLTATMAASTLGIGLLVYALIDLQQNLAKTSQIKAIVAQQQLTASLKETANEVDELAKKYQEINPNLSENENKLRANEAVLKSYQTALEGVATTDPKYTEKTTAIKEQIKALEDNSASLRGQVELTKAIGTNTGVSTGKTKELSQAQKEAAEKHKELTAFSRGYELQMQDTTYATDEFTRSIGEKIQAIGQVPQAGVLLKTFEDLSKLPTITAPFQDMGDLSEGFTPTLEFADVDESVVTKRLLAFQQRAEQFRQQANAALQQGAVDTVSGFAGAIGEAFAGGDGAFKNFGQALLGNLGEIMQQLGKAAIGIGMTMEAIKKAFTNPFTAIAAGIALIAVGKFISTKVSGMTSGGGGGGSRFAGSTNTSGQNAGLTAFAAGGIVSGPTAALVGEYPGAKNNPEVIAPLNKLQNMMGGNVTFTISGDNLVGTLNRANKTRARKF
jgi:TP901 family phage tail tape measure protein